MSEMAKIKRNPAAAKIAQAILEEYDVNSVEDMQSALKDVFGPMFEAMLKGEMNNHLGYSSNSKEHGQQKKRHYSKDTENNHGRSTNQCAKRSRRLF